MCIVIEDLVSLILDSNPNWWQRDFPRLALVSAAWLHPVRVRLYARPALTTYRACHNLARSLDENPFLLHFIHTLDLRPAPALWGADADAAAYPPPESIMATSVPRLLALTRLEALTLAGDAAACAPRLLRAVAAPHTIATLRIEGSLRRDAGVASGLWQSRLPLLEWHPELTARFSRLTSLSLASVVLDIAEPLVFDGGGDGEKSGMPGCMLEELTLDRVELAPSSGPLSSLLGGPDAWQCLRTLSITGGAFDRHHLYGFLCAVHASLEHVVLRRYPKVLTPFLRLGLSLEPFVAALPPFRNVRTLTMSDVLLDLDALAGLAHRFPGVERLDINEFYGGWCPPVLWAAFLAESDAGTQCLPKLKKLAVGESFVKYGCAAGSTKPTNTGILKEACAARDIELSYTVNV
ncbi:hypothetical protein DFH11DRAFT_1619511 [Phellopilus nigrolimitatus]|nr:hypothetical protein DFH11DRAFT_1619511 [Phellopilus nigrolimitatus]